MRRTSVSFSKWGAGIALGLVLASFSAPGIAFAQVAPITPPTTTVASPLDEAVPASPRPAARPFTPIAPNPAVPIPGVVFSPATEQDGEVSIPYLAQYISGIYRLSVGLGAILAAVMIVYGGFRYLLAASVPDVKDGKSIITDAVIGLVVLLSSFLILKTINPKLVEMNPIRVQRIQEEVPVATSEFTGNPAHTGFDVVNGDSPTCGGGGNQTIEGVSFQVLPLRGRYFQSSSPWGNLSYGPNLTQNESNNPCKGDGSEGTGFRQPIVNGCTQTIKNGGCGVTAFAEIMAYYGVQATNPGDATLAQNVKMWNGDQLVPLAQHPRGQGILTKLQARVGSHLYDPIDAARRAVERGDAGHGGSASTNGTSFMAMDGFRKESFRDPARAAQLIRGGNPVVIYCHHCKLKFRSMSDADHRGGAHFMVLHGVSSDGRWFLIHDVGGGGRAGGKFISADEIRSGMQEGRADRHSVSLTAIIPNGATVQACNTSPGGPGAGTNNAAGGAGTPAASGEVSRNGFSYSPATGASSVGWGQQSQILFPTRLTAAFRAGGTRPRVHLYIFVHGINSDAHDIDYVTSDSHPNSGLNSMKRALSQVAGSKNIIVAMPHNMDTRAGTYMSGFNLQEFYTRSVAAIASTIPGFQASDIQDVVVGGHSAATCQGPGNPLLKQAIGFNPGPRLLGIVAYDGCMSDSVFTEANFRTPSGVALLMNPDLKGMGHDDSRLRYQLIRQQWELRRIACPSTVSNACPMGTPPPDIAAPGYDQRRCNACYGRTVDGKQIVSFETAYGHSESIAPMTTNVFNAFYTN